MRDKVVQLPRRTREKSGWSGSCGARQTCSRWLRKQTLSFLWGGAAYLKDAVTLEPYGDDKRLWMATVYLVLHVDVSGMYHLGLCIRLQSSKGL